VVELDNYKVELSSYEQPLAEVRDSLNLGDKRYRIEELEKNMEAPDFWDDSEKASQAMKEVKDLKDIVGRADGLQQKYEDIMTLIEMAYEEEDEELAAEIGEELAALIFVLRRCLPASTMTAMPSLHCMPVPAVPRAATGRACSAVCISAGQRKKDILWKCLISWMERKLD
jgi:hypothetical protein